MHCKTDTHNALPYSVSSYLITNADISISLEQQLNYCHTAFHGGQVECCTPFLCVYGEGLLQTGRKGGQEEGKEDVRWKGSENLRRYRGRMVRHCNGWIKGKNSRRREGSEGGKRDGTRSK